MSNSHEIKAPIELNVDELEERIAPGGLTTAAAAAGQAIPPAPADAGLVTASAAAVIAVPPTAAS